MLEDILKQKSAFKLVCGAGNENIEEIEKLIYVYSKAGCKFFDLCADKDVIICARNILKKLGNLSSTYLCASFGIKGDPHTLKAQINEKCSKCRLCENICPQNAIKNNFIDSKSCIGCKKCLSVCKNNAIDFISKPKNIDEILPEIANLVDCIEYHAISDNKKEVYSNWEKINEHFKGFLSICIDRFLLSNKDLIERLNYMLKNRKPHSTIIQADGAPMSGGCDDYKTTLQAIACAEIIQNAKLPIYLLISGGTNSKSKELAKMCSIDINGVSIGSYARKIVKKYIESKNFWQNNNVQQKAIEIAKNLIYLSI